VRNIEDTYRHKGLRARLVQELKEKGIKDEQVLNAIGRVPRHVFFESSFVKFAYQDQAFPISAGQTISQPYTVAYQTQLLELNKSDRVLEIGTGSGYQAAVLMEIGVTLFSIERQRELFEKSNRQLSIMGYQGRFFLGDGYQGLPGFAPFDKIIITAGAPFIPQELLKQLVIGGVMVIPVGEKTQIMVKIVRLSETEFKQQKFGEFAFVPMLKGIIK